MSSEANEKELLKPFSTMQLLNFCLGFFGLQFAWQMRIILSAPVTENLGASPLIFGLIWLAGPITGMVVQPIIGGLSDKTHTILGKRRPYLLLGAIFASLALWAFPNSADIAQKLADLLHIPLPAFGGLIIAAIMIWVIDACVNAAQGPYRALIPDLVPPQQHSLANAYLSFAIGLGSVVAAGTAPFLKYVCNYQMSINAQFIMAALAFSLAMLWTCITIKEHKYNKQNIINNDEIKKDDIPFIKKVINFFKTSPEVGKICTLQLFTWIGIMSLNIFFTQYATHTVFGIPDLTTATDEVKNSYIHLMNKATNFSSICFAIQNLICFLVSIPIGLLSTKFGNKRVHLISLITLSLTFIGMGLYKEPGFVLFCMAIAGIGWASILALPFAMLSEFIQKGSEGSVMGIFNIFIAGPQVLVCTVLAWFINQCSYEFQSGINYHWEYAFFIGAITLIVAAIITHFINEKK